MMDSELQHAVSRAVEAATGRPFRWQGDRSVSGGCIHQARWIEGEGDMHYFLKWNAREKEALLTTERTSLQVLRDAAAVRIPEPAAWGNTEEFAFLVLEAIELRNRGDHDRMGRELAQLHRQESPDGRFGWQEDNFIGATAQENGWKESWAVFFVERRLEPQLRWAGEKGRAFRKAEPVLQRVAELLEGHAVAPSLLHGDLWGGNAGFDETGAPVLYDPACYYGDRETDLAFTRMFGGFPEAFYQAYEEAWPLPEGAEERSEIYNLYHLLNHFNLFGGGYGESAQQVMNRWGASS